MIRSTAMFVLRLVSVGLVVLLAACGGARLPPRGIQTLPPDSLAMLREAMSQVRPAFRTQRDALLAGTYAGHPAAGRGKEAAVAGPAPALPLSGPFVIQIAAYGDSASAEKARSAAEQQFPEMLGLVERSGAAHRVALGSWPTPEAAEAELRRIRQRYPGAWVRRRALP